MVDINNNQDTLDGGGGSPLVRDRAPEIKKLKAIDCPNCGSPIALRALGQSVMVACGNCGTQLDVSRPQIKIIQKYDGITQTFQIKLGSRGNLRGQLYEVVGAMRRSDSGYAWNEYLLFNPYIGFRWLVQDGGHWSFCEPIKDVSAIGAKGSSLTYRDLSYSLFNRGTVKVETVIGEFYWRVESGDSAEATDYISPPHALSKEKSDGEITWSLLTYLEPSEVEGAFKIRSIDRSFIAYNQPNPFSQAVKPIGKIMVITLLASMLIQSFTAIRARSVETSLGIINPARTTENDDNTFGPITLTTSHSLNELSAASYGMDNSWVELNCSLVNTQTGESYDFNNAFEHYSGYDSDGHWSEGNDHHTSLLRDVPAGEYNLVVNAATDNPSRQIDLRWKHDVTPWQNFWLVFFGIMLYPGYLLYRRFDFEKNRWSQSDYSPYASGDDDDDDDD